MGQRRPNRDAAPDFLDEQGNPITARQAEARRKAAETARAAAPDRLDAQGRPLTTPNTERGSALQRFAEPILQVPGAAMRFMGDMAHSVLPTEGGAAARQRVGQGVVDPAVAQANQSAEAFQQGRLGPMLGHAAGAIPVFGPPIAGGVEKIQSGDVAGGLGELTATAAPFLTGPLARGVGRGAVAALKETPAAEAIASRADASSAKRMTATITPQTGANKTRFGNQAAEIAPALAREPGLNAFSRDSLHGKVEGKFAEAQAGLDAAADARLVSQQVQVGPLLAGLDEAIAKLTATPVDASAFPRRRNMPPPPTKGEQVQGLTGEIASKDVATTTPFGDAVEPAPNAAQIATLRQIRSELARLGPTAPYESVRRIRQAWDHVAQVKYMPSTAQDVLKAQGDASGAETGTAVIREGLAGTDPTTADANARYTLFKSAKQVLDATEEAERVRPNRGRGIIAHATGAMIGAREGGGIGAGIGAVVGGMVDSAAQMAPTFQIAIARRLAGVADALRRGDVEGAQATLETTVRRFPKVKGGLEITGKVSGVAGQAGVLRAADEQRKKDNSAPAR